MTRGNLNFVYQNMGEAPRTLFHYQNGDQYPEGLLLHCGIEEFLAMDRLWTPDDFCAWIRTNYRQPCRKMVPLKNGMTLDCHAESDQPAEAEDLGESGQPRIYYTEGFITDYSYVFCRGSTFGRKRKNGTRDMSSVNYVHVWKWDRLIFSATATRCLKWMRKLAEERSEKQNAYLNNEASLRGTLTEKIRDAADAAAA